MAEASRWSQFHYGRRLIDRAWILRAELRAATAQGRPPHREDGTQARRAAARLLCLLTLERSGADLPSAPDLLATIRTRFRAEADTETLCDLIPAYPRYTRAGRLPRGLLPLAALVHPRTASPNTPSASPAGSNTPASTPARLCWNGCDGNDDGRDRGPS